jgi:hypothetical protein
MHIKISQKLIQPEWRYFLCMKRALANDDFLIKPKYTNIPVPIYPKFNKSKKIFAEMLQM